MTKPDLMAELAELAEVDRRAKEATLASDAKAMIAIAFDALDIVHLRHAELEAAVRKAARYDWIVERVEADEVDYMLPSVCRIDFKPGEELNGMHDSLDTAIDQAMHNSAREG